MSHHSLKLIVLLESLGIDLRIVESAGVLLELSGPSDEPSRKVAAVLVSASVDAGGQVFDLELQLWAHQASDLAMVTPLHVLVAEYYVQVEAS